MWQFENHQQDETPQKNHLEENDGLTKKENPTKEHEETSNEAHSSHDECSLVVEKRILKIYDVTENYVISWLRHHPCLLFLPNLTAPIQNLLWQTM